MPEQKFSFWNVWQQNYVIGSFCKTRATLLVPDSSQGSDQRKNLFRCSNHGASATAGVRIRTCCATLGVCAECTNALTITSNRGKVVFHCSTQEVNLFMLFLGEDGRSYVPETAKRHTLPFQKRPHAMPRNGHECDSLLPGLASLVKEAESAAAESVFCKLKDGNIANVQCWNSVW